MVSGYNEANDYPPGLVAACDQYLQGREVMGDNELAHVAGEAVNAYGIRSSKP
jgi:hypothetical protein